MPVCPENSDQTYFSPCYGKSLQSRKRHSIALICDFNFLSAGCSMEILINNVRVYGNCSCGADTEIIKTGLIATEGACGMENCQSSWISHQVLSVIASALLGSTLIGKLIITLRSVLPQDKCTALSLELFFLGLIVYIPGKIGYRFIASKFRKFKRLSR